MQSRRCAVWLGILLAGACSRDDGAADARAAVDALQAALHGGDRARCRELVTAESAQALPSLPWAELRQRTPLVVLGARPRHAGWFVDVGDPATAAARGTFVVVREYGRTVVDLVASAGLTAEEVVGTGAQEVLEPRELTPADLDRIRQIELAAPQR